MKTHQMRNTRFWRIWRDMKTRCNNKNYRLYKDYGGRGIKICERWIKFENFRDDMLKTYKDTLSIERIDNDGNYEPNNCRWATRKEQNINKRMHKLTKNKVKEIRNRYCYGNGKKLSREYGVCPGVISEIVNFKRNYENC